MRGIILLGCAPKVGKTFVAALWLNALKRQGLNAGYFKFADTQCTSIEDSDAGFIQEQNLVDQELSEMLPYYFESHLPVHLASRESRRMINASVISERFAWNLATHSHMVVEGVGEVISPLILEENLVVMQEDLIRRMRLNIVLVVKASSTALNHTALATHYLKSIGLAPRGIIINGFDENNFLHRDVMLNIERFCQTKVISTVAMADKQFRLRVPLEQVFAEPQVVA